MVTRCITIIIITCYGNDRDVIITRVVNEHLGAGSEIPYLLSSLYSLFQW